MRIECHPLIASTLPLLTLQSTLNTAISHANTLIDVPITNCVLWGREDLAAQSLTAMKSTFNEPPEGNNGGSAGLVRRARIPLVLDP